MFTSSKFSKKFYFHFIFISHISKYKTKKKQIKNFNRTTSRTFREMWSSCLPSMVTAVNSQKAANRCVWNTTPYECCYLGIFKSKTR